MTLDELKAIVANKASHAAQDQRREQKRRNLVIVEQLAKWGLTTADGWTIVERPYGIWIGHPPELPLPIGLLLSGDGQDRLFVEYRTTVLTNAEDAYAVLLDINS